VDTPPRLYGEAASARKRGTLASCSCDAKDRRPCQPHEVRPAQLPCSRSWLSAGPGPGTGENLCSVWLPSGAEPRDTVSLQVTAATQTLPRESPGSTCTFGTSLSSGPGHGMGSFGWRASLIRNVVITRKSATSGTWLGHQNPTSPRRTALWENSLDPNTRHSPLRTRTQNKPACITGDGGEDQSRGRARCRRPRICPSKALSVYPMMSQSSSPGVVYFRARLCHADLIRPRRYSPGEASFQMAGH
jgi:hypothetical protein